MRLLIDTNIFLEVVLERDAAGDAKHLLSSVGAHDFFVSDFTLHSIGVFFFRRRQHEVFGRFLKDMLDLGMAVVSLPVESMKPIVSIAVKFNLDFDDAYQYMVAETHDLTIVSLDSDFDRTDRGRKTPMEALKG